MSRSVLFAPIAAISVAACAAAPAPVAHTRIKEGKIGTGAEAHAGQNVTVHYTGWLYQNGKRTTKFDSSRDRGQPFSFDLGMDEVIKGWDVGVAGMKVGGTRTLIIPPEEGYGAEGDDTIPANSWLIFDVELLKVD